MTAVLFQSVSRHFGAVRAVDGVDLAIAEGEFFAMLGPSGSGKTTCLRLIAGFEQPTAGHIEIFGETAEGVPPYRRAVNTVFQDYALFPHLTILDNVAYGLMVRGIGKAERRRQAEEALAMVALPGYGARKPGQLSGGQRQRVALARALVNRPRVLLLDEPLGALDLKLREQMQEELKSLQKSLGLTFVFVTHDQSEALSMADRVAVFNEGKVQQVGTPEEIYRRPKSRFVGSELFGRDPVSFGAGLIGMLAKLDQLTDRFDCQSQFTCVFDEGQAVTFTRRIPALVAFGAVRARQQARLLIVADRRDFDARGLGKITDGKHVLVSIATGGPSQQFTRQRPRRSQRAFIN